MAEDESFDRYTAGLTVEDFDKLNPTIAAAMAELRRHFSDPSIQALHWNENYVAVPLTVTVRLPSRGPVGGVDIRRREPVVLLLHRKRYPYLAPLAYSDRRDFPKASLPHLNPTKATAPAWFCLHRGNLNTWFAEHGIVDLINRVRGWLRDGARDRLVPARDMFEPTRCHTTLGNLVYDHAAFLGLGLALLPRTVFDLNFKCSG